MSKEKNSKWYYYELYDQEGEYGIVMIKDVKTRKFANLVKSYIKTDEEEYNNQDFWKWLKKNGFEIKVIEPEPIYF